MRRILTILLVSGILLQQFSKTFIVADFLVHRDYITNNLCENKNNPAMHCNGKCHLRKELANDDRRQGSDNKNITPNDDVLVWELTSTASMILIAPHSTLLLKNGVESDYLADLQGLLRPPCA